MSSSGFSIRTAIFSILLALSLWAYVSLRSTYDVVATVPLEFVLPSDRSVETLVPSDVRVKLRATGWHLLNILYLNAQSSCVIDLATATTTTVRVAVEDMKQGFRSPVPAQVVEVLTDEFDVQLGIVGRKRVPLVSRVRMVCAQGYTVVGKVELTPDSVTLRGNVKVLAGIDAWYTRERTVDEANADVAGFIAVSDSLRSILRVEPKSVRYRARIQRSADIEIDDVPVTIMGAPESGSAHMLSPMLVTVALRGGLGDMETVMRDDLKVVVDYAEVLADTTGSIVPVVIAPPTVSVLGIRPTTLIHVIPAREPAVRERAEKRLRN
ncbi:MAG: hypothetical protein ACKOBV_11075 [Candidatus Kapaibacterium sp.]